MVDEPHPSNENSSDDDCSKDALDDRVVPLRRPRREQLVREVLGAVLREERIAQDRTLADVAGSAHVSLPYLSEIERGTKEVSSTILQAITTALEVETAEILERCAHRLRFEARAGRVLGLAA